MYHMLYLLPISLYMRVCADTSADTEYQRLGVPDARALHIRRKNASTLPSEITAEKEG